MISRELNKKLELWGMSDSENDLGETTRVSAKIKDIWCKVTPKHGSTQETGSTDTESVKLTLNIRCRKLSVSDPSIDMFFKNGDIKYEIIDWIEDFQGKSFYEFYCRAIYE